MSHSKPPKPARRCHTAPSPPPDDTLRLECLYCLTPLSVQWGIRLLAVVAGILLATPALVAATLVPEGLAEGKVIVLDPGHGGHDAGSRFASNMTEKDITLNLALSLKKALHGLCRTYLTREGDYWVDLQKRTTLANYRRADLFVSLHSSGSLDPHAGGVRVFYHANDGKRPLPSDSRGELGEPGDGLVPWDVVQNSHRPRSKLLATTLHQRFVAEGLSSPRDLFTAPLYVLKGADCPAVMIEMGLVTSGRTQGHPSEEETFDILIRAIAEGLNAYFGKSGSCITESDMIEEDIPTGRGAAW